MKDDGRIPRIKDTDMTDRLLMAGAIADATPSVTSRHASPVTAARASTCSTAACPASPKPGRWIGNGVLDGFLEDESLFGEFLRAPVCEGGVESLVVGPPHIVVGVGA